MEYNNPKNYGFLEPTIQPKDWHEGKIELKFGAQQVLQENGQWDTFLPETEAQVKKTETSNCTGFATNNALEIIMARRFGGLYDYSDRATGILAETRPPGNDPNKVIEAVRDNGLLPEADLPFSDDITSPDQYYSPSPLPSALLTKCKLFLKTYTIAHEWVTNDPASLMRNLKYSPLGVSVFAWAKDGDLYYKPAGEKDNHWTLCVGYKENEYWLIFDSYTDEGSPIKKLRWDYQFGYVKKYSVIDQPTPEQISILQKILAKLAEVLKLLFLQSEQIKQNLPVIDAIPNELIAPETKPKTLYEWDTKEHIKASIKKIALEYGVDGQLACNVAQCESGLDIRAVRTNTNKTKDRGLYQWNNYWHPEITDEIAFDPEQATRLFCKAVKAGNLSWWNSSKKCWNIV